jgi:5S rRNA maturation endonuclease (ribonuclease M5)
MPTVVAAYDNDEKGNEMARLIKQLLPQTTRLKPKVKDWNEQLDNALYFNTIRRQQQQEL